MADMDKKVVILPLAAAVASLTAPAIETANAKAPESVKASEGVFETKPAGVQPNTFFAVGEDLLSLVVTKAADGTLLAQHYSHSSHASHSSHSSHYSSR